MILIGLHLKKKLLQKKIKDSIKKLKITYFIPLHYQLSLGPLTTKTLNNKGRTAEYSK